MRDISCSKVVFIIALVCFGNSFLLSQEFTDTEEDWSVAYDNCSGTLSVTVLYHDQDNADGDDYMHWVDVEYKNSSGSWIKFFEWDRTNTLSGYDGIIYLPDICNHDGNSDEFAYYRYSKSGVSLSVNQIGQHRFFTAIYANLPDDLFGQQVEVRIRGWWRGCGGGGDNAFNSGSNDGYVRSTASQVGTSSSPSGLDASLDEHCNRVTLTWNNPSNNATDCDNSKNSTEVYRKLSSSSSWPSTPISEVDFPTSTYDDAGVDKGVDYDYRVRHVFKPNSYRTDKSGFSSVILGRRLGKFEPPTNVEASDNICDEKEIKLTWTWSGTDPENGFKIQRASNSSFTEGVRTLTTVSGDLREYVDTNINQKQIYYYRIMSINKCGDESDASTVTSGVSPDIPDMVDNVSLSVDNVNGTIAIRWRDQSTDEEEFVVKRYFIGAGSEEFIVASPSTTETDSYYEYVDTQIDACQSYSYSIRTRNSCGESDESSFVTDRLEPDLSLAFTDGESDASKGYFTDRVRLTWGLGGNNENIIDEYEIRRRQLGSAESFIFLDRTSGAGLYNDREADAGVLYEYQVFGITDCEDIIYTDTSYLIGFRSKSGIVSGQVTYTGGIAVEDVKVIAESDLPVGSSLHLAGGEVLIPHDDNLDLTDEMLIETWVKVLDKDVTQGIIEMDGVYRLIYDQPNNRFTTDVSYNGESVRVEFSGDLIEIGQWAHIASQVHNDSLHIYLNGDAMNKTALLGGDGTGFLQNDTDIEIGDGWKGNMKEMRIWNISKTDKEIFQDYQRFMIGKEVGLRVLLPMTENTGNFVYDRSRRNSTIFNRNHGRLTGGAAWSIDSPSKSQLSYAAFTDSIGNYQIQLPYTSVGENYTLTPQYLTHQFDPATRVLFVGDGSTVLNGIDFEDISAFPVTGTLFYKNSSCPVEGAFLKIDGVNVLKNGQAVVTDANGDWDINVPIGEHFITVEQPGHIYATGRFPSSGFFDFQEPVSGIEFVDSTFLRLVGRVVGGTVEANKEPALGLSVNNLGVAELVFTSQQGGGCYTDTIKTDPATGEYSVSLPPLNFVPTVNIVGNPTIDFGTLDLISLAGNPPLKTSKDTVYNAGGQFERVDSALYHIRQDYIHRVQAQIRVLHADGIRPFIGDTLYTYTDPRDNSITERNLWNDPMRWPVFANTDDIYKYPSMIQIFEEYTNADNGESDLVPTRDGRLTINNELAAIPMFSVDVKESIEMDSTCAANVDILCSLPYRFKLGEGSLIENQSIPEYSFTKTMEVSYTSPSGVTSKWLPFSTNPPSMPGQFQEVTTGDGTFRGFVLAPMTDGNQFVTTGPERPEFVLRDPPGSGSSASRSVNTSQSSTQQWSWNVGASVAAVDKTSIGAKFLTGLGLAVESETKNEGNIGFSSTISGGRNGKLSTTISNTDAWSTNGAPSLVGGPSDIFIGVAQNLQYGLNENLVFVPSDLCSEVECFDGGSLIQPNGLIPARIYGLTIVPDSFTTSFIYTQWHIENNLLPQLQEARNALLQDVSGKYTSHLAVSDSLYGLNNDDPLFGSLAVTPSSGSPEGGGFETLSGPSYTYDAEDQEDSISGDQVRFFNKQIRLWEESLALNEWEKIHIDNPEVIDSLEQAELDELADEYRPYIGTYVAFGVVELAGLITTQVGQALVPLPGVAAAGFVTLAVTTATAITGAELEHYILEYAAKKRLIKERFEANRGFKNYSVSSGASFTGSSSSSIASSRGGTFNYDLNGTIGVELEGKVNNTGIGFKKELKLTTKRSRDWGTSESSSESISFTLNDGDKGDNFSVDVYPSVFGWGPIFKRKEGGQSSCPYEGEEITKYYQYHYEADGNTIEDPNVPSDPVVLTERTQQVDKPTISSTQTLLTNIPSNESAVFNLTLGNETESDLSRTYEVEVVSASNPFGAIVRIDGLSTTSVRIPSGTSINKVLTIEKGAGPIYEYNDIEVIIYPACQKTLRQSLFLTAHFLPSCTEASLASPEDQWVLNNSFNDTLPVAIIDYNINTFDLNRLRFEYKSSDDPNWIGLQSWWKDTSVVNDPSALPIPSNTTFTLYDWDVGQIVDGFYDLRVTAQCENASSNSVIHRGYMDRIDPHAFGSPSPADGVLDPDDDILLTMNEIVEVGSITSKKIDVRGVLNGTEIKHETSVSFDGINSVATIPEYQLQKRSLAIEFWLKRNGVGKQTILTQGNSSSDQLLIRFDANDRLQFQLEDKIITSSTSISDSIWHHYTVSYDRSSGNGEIFIDFKLNQSDNNFTPSYNSTGPIYIGGVSPIAHADIHELRLWSIPLTEAEITAKGNETLSGREAGLIGNWPMTEGYGHVAFDKVRGRHMQLSNTTWSILPTNHSVMLDGINDYLVVSAGDLGFSEEADLTFEAWFKTGASVKQTIFSNGLATGTNGQDSDWALSLDSEGYVSIENSGNSFKTPLTYNDNNWHHVSVVIERTRAVSIYMDGELVTTGNASVFASFSGPKLWIGTRGYFIGSNEVRSQFFNGKIDDIRIWNTARMSEQIQRDFVHQLSGDELGLQVYYPFDGIINDAGITKRIPDLNDASVNSYDLSHNGAAMSSFSEDAPPIKLPRLIEKVNFTYSINEDQIFIEVTDPASRIENTTLDITVKRIQDLAGNEMQSPETWIAYIDKNQVFWETEYYNFEKPLNDNLLFTATIKNTGGSQESFSLSNLPVWLTASPSSGLIDPNSSIEVTFNVSTFIEIGEYEHDVFVSTESFGFNERLLLNLKVFADPPDWEVDQSKYEGSMSYVGQLVLNGIISSDDEDIIVALIDDEVRGRANVQLSSNTGKYLVFLDVFGNPSDTLADGTSKNITFKIWDASEGKIHPYVSPFGDIWVDGALEGSLSTPVPFTAANDEELSYYLNAGWNWISFPLESTELDSLESLLSQLDITPGDRILSHQSSALYASDTSGWYMDDSLKQNGLLIKDGYRLYVAEADTLVYNGVFENPALYPILLKSGWNSIGMISEGVQDITTALASLNPQNGDWIKGQKSFAVFETGFGWSGSLEIMAPQNSYMLYMQSEDVLTYQDVGLFKNQKTKSTGLQEKLYADYSIVPEQYEHSMSIVATVEGFKLWNTSNEWYIAAYKGGQCQGINRIDMDGRRNARLTYLQVFGNDSDELHFKLLSADGNQVIDLNEIHRFLSNGTMGLPSSPEIFTTGNSPCAEQMDLRHDYMTYASESGVIQVVKRLTLNAILKSYEDLTLRAGEGIELRPGFEAPIGSSIDLTIQPCDQ